LVLVAAGIGLGLVAAEILVRVAGPEIEIVFRESIAPIDDPVLGYGLRPGATDGEARISTQGLRDRDYPQPKPDGVVRLAVIGDSIAFGYGNPPEQTFPKRLEEHFAPCRAPRVEVMNLGVPGYNAVQVAARLRAFGVALEPDAVVYGYSLNDPQDYSIEAEALDALRDAFARGTDAGMGRWLRYSRLYLLARKIGLEGVRREAIRARNLMDPAWAAAKSGSQVEYFRALHREAESAERLRRGLDDLAAIARERELPVLVAVFPVLGKRPGAGHDGMPLQELADVHEQVASLAAARGFATLDLLPAYARPLGKRRWLDFMHPDATGHQIAADAIRDWMCANAWPPGASLACGCAQSTWRPSSGKTRDSLASR
jgi:lysophospholipase L1-like esterase